MDDFLRFYNKVKNNRGWGLDIRHSSIVDWMITIGYKYTHPKYGEVFITVQHCDMELAFAMAHVQLKEYLLEEEGGY